MHPAGNVLDFNSLTSPFLSFRVIQAGYWPGFNLESVFFIINNIFITKNLTDFRKMLETNVDPRLLIRMLFESVQPKSAQNQTVCII